MPGVQVIYHLIMLEIQIVNLSCWVVLSQLSRFIIQGIKKSMNSLFLLGS